MNSQKVSTSNVSNITLSKHVQRSAFNSLTKMMPGSRFDVGGSTTTKTSKKRMRAKPYEPIRLPEDILTIQAHTVSTPVTELPYLLIAAHIGALPTARQFYPATSATHSPLTVFRDMFVMTIDVRGYKPSSVRLSTEGRLIIIECLQSEVPQVVFTQTGTVDTNNKYVMDPTPKVNELPVHTSFNYVQHRVKLPEDFSEEGLKVGMDDVSGHVIITGRLVHNQRAAFPEPWNQNKVVKKPKGPLVNTSSVNLSKEDARKLAAWNAVQGNPQSKMEEIGNTNFMAYGKKQWLEKEGAKLRAIQHRALKENIRKLTEMKKGNTTSPQSSNEGSEVAQAASKSPQGISQKPRSNSSSQITNSSESQQDKTLGLEANVNDTVSDITSILPKTAETRITIKPGSSGKSEAHGNKTPTKGKDSRPKVSFQHEMKSPLQNKKSKTDAGQKKRVSQRLNQKNFRRKPKVEDRRKAGKVKTEGNVVANNEAEDPGTFTLEAMTSNSDPKPSPVPVPEASKESKSNQSLNRNQINPDGGTNTKSNSEISETTNPTVIPVEIPSDNLSPATDAGDAENVQDKGMTESVVTEKIDPPAEEPSMETGTVVASSVEIKYAERAKSKSRTISNVSVRALDVSPTPTPTPTVSDVKEGLPVSFRAAELEDGDDHVGKQDKAMWEKLLNFAGVRRRQKPKSRSPSPDPKN